MNKSRSLQAMCFALLSSVLLAGCGSGDPVASSVAKLNKNNTSRAANCYALYQDRNGYKGPKSMEQLKTFLQSPTVTKNLEMMGIDDIDAVFISERDDEELTMRWNVKGSSRGCYEPVAFETTGVDGSRLVGFANGTFEEVDDEQTYNDMLKGKHKPGNSRQEAVIPEFDNQGNQKN
jgi:hypothetical protein